MRFDHPGHQEGSASVDDLSVVFHQGISGRGYGSNSVAFYQDLTRVRIRAGAVEDRRVVGPLDHVLLPVGEVVGDPLHLPGIEQDRAAPPGFEVEEARRFAVARLGTAAILPSDPAVAALLTQRGAIERELDAVKEKKAALREDAYYDELETAQGEDAAEILTDVINGLVAQLDAPLLCIGVGVPGVVDVSSGVEASPGVKDPMKIREFVRNARAGAR